MSASLVGSEMCIRDSDASVASARNDGSEYGVGEYVGSGLGTRASQVDDCLLYTSDAADDM
eukprot:9026200-Alexandrium_andersonii.AAC.1